MERRAEARAAPLEGSNFLLRRAGRIKHPRQVAKVAKQKKKVQRAR